MASASAGPLQRYLKSLTLTWETRMPTGKSAPAAAWMASTTSTSTTACGWRPSRRSRPCGGSCSRSGTGPAGSRWRRGPRRRRSRPSVLASAAATNPATASAMSSAVISRGSATGRRRRSRAACRPRLDRRRGDGDVAVPVALDERAGVHELEEHRAARRVHASATRAQARTCASVTIAGWFGVRLAVRVVGVGALADRRGRSRRARSRVVVGHRRRSATPSPAVLTRDIGATASRLAQRERRRSRRAAAGGRSSRTRSTAVWGRRR